LVKENFINKDMRGTMLKLRILRSMSKSKTNSYALLKEFKANERFKKYLGGQRNIKNEVYNTINSLEKFKYIKSVQKTEKGRLKNYYTLTSKGDKVLKSAGRLFKIHIKELTLLLNG
jgi:DNA-binding PadR family transcriptional regulator